MRCNTSVLKYEQWERVLINVLYLLLFCLLSQLRKAVMDHISDSFLETNVPLLVLIEAAKSGNEKEVKEYAQVFREHANKLVEVSDCGGSHTSEGPALVEKWLKLISETA